MRVEGLPLSFKESYESFKQHNTFFRHLQYIALIKNIAPTYKNICLSMPFYHDLMLKTTF